MKTAKLILWSAIINLFGLIISIVIFTLVLNKVIPAIFIGIVIIIIFFLFFTGSQMITFYIKEKLFIMKYEELIKLIEEEEAARQKALKMIKVLGEHEAIKLYNEKYPKKDAI